MASRSWAEARGLSKGGRRAARLRSPDVAAFVHSSLRCTLRGVRARLRRQERGGGGMVLEYFTVENFLELLRLPIVNVLVAPVLLFAGTALWKVRIRPAGPLPEDYAIGLDLITVAVGVQLSFLLGFAEENDQLAIAHGLRLLGVTVLVFLALAQFLHRWGFGSDGRTIQVWTGAVIPDIIGGIVLVGVFAGNTLGVRL